MTPNKPDSGNPLYRVESRRPVTFSPGTEMAITVPFRECCIPWKGPGTHSHEAGVGAGLYTTRFGSPIAAYARTRDHSLSVLTVAAAPKLVPWVSRDTGPWQFMTVPNAEGKGVEPSGLPPAPAFEAGCPPSDATLQCAPGTATETGTREPRWGSERVRGIEPRPVAWKAPVLPLNYTRIYVTRDSRKPPE